MLFNNARCRALTPDYVNTASGLELHQFKWLANDELIGTLPNRWNHLVAYDPPRAPTRRSCTTRAGGRGGPSPQGLRFATASW